jgi:hypothetical protein
MRRFGAPTPRRLSQLPARGSEPNRRRFAAAGGRRAAPGHTDGAVRSAGHSLVFSLPSSAWERRSGSSASPDDIRDGASRLGWGWHRAPTLPSSAAAARMPPSPLKATPRSLLPAVSAGSTSRPVPASHTRSGCGCPVWCGGGAPSHSAHSVHPGPSGIAAQGAGKSGLMPVAPPVGPLGPSEPPKPRSRKGRPSDPGHKSKGDQRLRRGAHSDHSAPQRPPSGHPQPDQELGSCLAPRRQFGLPSGRRRSP